MAPSDDHYRALGRVAHEFSLLEHIASMAIWTALGDMNKREFRAVTAEMSANAKLGLLEGLVKMREQDPDRLRRWRGLFADAKSVSTERNRLLHSPLFSSDLTQLTDEVTTFQIERGSAARGDFATQTYTVESMEAVAERARSARNDLLGLLGVPSVRKAP